MVLQCLSLPAQEVSVSLQKEEEPAPKETQNGQHEKEKEEAKEEVADTEEPGTKDEPEPEPSRGLEDPEAEDIKTITAGDTMYSSAKKFEDLPISEPLLQAR